MAFKFRAPSLTFVAGCTQSGKTQFTLKVIKNANKMFEKPVTKIVYCYSIYQDVFNKLKPNVTFHQNLPTLKDIDKWSKDQDHTFLILDDLLMDIINSKEMVQLFCVLSHHKNISVFFLSQTIFPPGKYSVILSRQMTYIILFKNARDAKQISILGSQIYPLNAYKLSQAYELATGSDYNYLLIDLNPCTLEKYRLRSKIFPDDQFQIVYNN